MLEAFEPHSTGGRVPICPGYVHGDVAIRRLQPGEFTMLARPFASDGRLASLCEGIGTRATKI